MFCRPAAEDEGAVGIAVPAAAPADALLGAVIDALPASFAAGGDPPRQSGSWFRHIVPETPGLR